MGNRTFLPSKCASCGAALTLEEAHYYGASCEKCEGAWHEDVQAFRRGEREDLPVHHSAATANDGEA